MSTPRGTAESSELPALVNPRERESITPQIGEERMDRREFNKALGAAVAGMVAGSAVFSRGQGKKGSKKDDKAAKHVCKGKNDCKGQGADGKNDCKGTGSCATLKHDCKGKNACKGQGGCAPGDNGCAGKNSCKGKGGCTVPVNAAHQKKK